MNKLRLPITFVLCIAVVILPLRTIASWEERLNEISEAEKFLVSVD